MSVCVRVCVRARVYVYVHVHAHVYVYVYVYVSPFLMWCEVVLLVQSRYTCCWSECVVHLPERYVAT